MATSELVRNKLASRSSRMRDSGLTRSLGSEELYHQQVIIANLYFTQK